MELSNTTCGEEHFSPERIFDDFEIDQEWIDAYRIYYIIVDSVFVLPTIFGNVLILIAIIRFPSLRKTASNTLIGNLAISDLLVGGVVFPIDLMTLVDNGFNSSLTFCLWHHCLIYTIVLASVLNLFVLSLERFHAIVRPLTHTLIFTRRRVCMICVLIWLIVCAFGFLPMYGWHKKVDQKRFKCRRTILFYNEYTNTICFSAVISLIVNAVLFFIIVRVALQTTSTLKLTGIRTNTLQQQKLRRDIHHTLMMLIVSGLFVVLWGPFCVLTLVPNPSDLIRFITNWSSSLGLINSSINWIIYGCRSKRFRVAFKSILKCQSRRSSDVLMNLST